MVSPIDFLGNLSLIGSWVFLDHSNHSKGLNEHRIGLETRACTLLRFYVIMEYIILWDSCENMCKYSLVSNGINFMD